MTFTEQKFSQENWRKDECDVGRNDVKRGITIFVNSYSEQNH